MYLWLALNYAFIKCQQKFLIFTALECQTREQRNCEEFQSSKDGRYFVYITEFVNTLLYNAWSEHVVSVYLEDLLIILARGSLNCFPGIMRLFCGVE